MKLKGLVWFFTIALTIISLWELSYTWVVRNYENSVTAKAEKIVKKTIRENVFILNLIYRFLIFCYKVLRN